METRRLESYDLLAPLQATSDGHTCQFCKRIFELKKSFNRHMRTVHQPIQETPFLCTKCERRFLRKDVLTRHETTQHGAQRTVVQCSVCHKHIRPRALAEHRASQVCKRAKAQVDKVQIEVLRAAFTDHYAKARFASVPAYLPAIIDVLLVSAWLWVKLRPWGRGRDSADVWLMRSQVAAPSIEFLELKGLVYRAVLKALRHYDPRREPYLLEAIVARTTVIMFTDGWDLGMTGIQAVVALERREIGSTGTKRAFVDSTIADAYKTVLSREVAVHQIASCWEMFRAHIKLVRVSAIDFIDEAPRYSNEAPELQIRQMRPEQWTGRYERELAHLAQLSLAIPDSAQASEPELG